MPHPLEFCIAFGVMPGLAWLCMGAAVHFDSETPLGAAEVNDIRSHGVLTAELKALDSESAQQAPRNFFGFGFTSPKLAGNGDLIVTAG
jgi:hypothetical protein